MSGRDWRLHRGTRERIKLELGVYLGKSQTSLLAAVETGPAEAPEKFPLFYHAVTARPSDGGVGDIARKSRFQAFNASEPPDAAVHVFAPQLEKIAQVGGTELIGFLDTFFRHY